MHKYNFDKTIQNISYMRGVSNSVINFLALSNPFGAQNGRYIWPKSYTVKTYNAKIH